MQSTNEILTHTMKRNHEALETILNSQKVLLDDKTDSVGEKLQSRRRILERNNENDLRSAQGHTNNDDRTALRTEGPQHLKSKLVRNDTFTDDGEKEGGIDETTSFHSIVSKKANCSKRTTTSSSSSQAFNEHEARMTPVDREILLLDREDDRIAVQKGGVKSKNIHLRERQVQKRKPRREMYKHGKDNSTAKDQRKIKFRVGMEEESRLRESRKVEERRQSHTQDSRGKPYEYNLMR